jgi:hypothetical protein
VPLPVCVHDETNTAEFSLMLVMFSKRTCETDPIVSFGLSREPPLLVMLMDCAAPIQLRTSHARAKVSLKLNFQSAAAVPITREKDHLNKDHRRDLAYFWDVNVPLPTQLVRSMLTLLNTALVKCPAPRQSIPIP